MIIINNKTISLDELFIDVQDEVEELGYEDIWELGIFQLDELSEVNIVDDRSDYVDEWYHHQTLIFDYKNTRYGIEYIEHTSPNVSDIETFEDKIFTIGHLDNNGNLLSDREIKQKVKIEELESIIMKYENKYGKLA